LPFFFGFGATMWALWHLSSNGIFAGRVRPVLWASARMQLL